MNHASNGLTAPGPAVSESDSELQPRWAAHKARVEQYLALDAEYVAIHGGKADQPLSSNSTGTTQDLEKSTEELLRRWRGLVKRWHALISTDETEGQNSSTKREGQSALCLSGGGIRSATFCLGVLQWLAHAGRLRQFHYLSTVSGGGYIGSWLTAWIRRQGFDESLQALAASAGEGRAPANASEEHEGDRGLGREPEPVRRLRAYSNYLSPALGLSGDMLALLGTFSRNLFLHWLAVVPLLLALLLIPRICFATMGQIPQAEICVLVSAGILIAIALGYVASDLPGYRPPDPPCRDRFKCYCLLPLGLAALLLGWVVLSPSITTYRLPAQWPISTHVPNELWFIGGLVGMILHFLGALLGCSLRLKRQPGTARWQGVIWYGLAGLLCGFASGALLGWGLTKLEAAGFGKWPRTPAAYIWTEGGAALGAPDGVATASVPAEWLGWYVTLAPPAVFAVLWVGATLYVGLISRIRNDEHREWWARAGGYWLLAAIAWILLCILVIHAPRWVLSIPAFQSAPGSATFGAAALLGVVSSAWGYWGKHGAAVKSQVKGLADRLGTRGLDLLSLAFIVALCIAFSIGTSVLLERFAVQASGDKIVTIETIIDDEVKAYRRELRCASSDVVAVKSGCERKEPDLPSAGKTLIAFDAVMRGSQPSWLLLATFVLLLITGSSFWWAINPNRFSLHGMYRNRLTRAYLGASADCGFDAGLKRKRRAHWFTGFDPKDDLSLSDDANEPGFPDGKWRLFPVINTTLNLVKPAGDRLEWQQRKAAPFAFTPLYCGSPRLGYAEPRRMGYGLIGEPGEEALAGATLGHAMALSGAAASPNMGYHSSTLVAFVMLLFNVRLGGWDRNPRGIRSRGSRLRSFWLLVDEMLGRTTDTRDLVYLSDGGHFENLGLYEMVLRRCHHIVVVDAAHDPQYEYEDLENCIRKVRVDLGISIDFDRGLPTPAACRENKSPFALGRVRYSDIDGPGAPDGLIVYLKPVLCGDEPLDVTRYAASSRKGAVSFPQQPTSDQFFDEAQFESYRMLGLEAARKAFGAEGEWPYEGPDHRGPRKGPSATPPAGVGVPATAGTDGAANSGAKLIAEGGGGLKSLSDAGKMALVAAGTAAITVTGTVSLRDTELRLSPESLQALRQIQREPDRERLQRLIADLGDSIDALRKRIDSPATTSEPGGLSQGIGSLSVAIGAAASAASGARGGQSSLQSQIDELVAKVQKLEADLILTGMTPQLIAQLQAASRQLANAAGVLSKALEKLPQAPASPASVAVQVTLTAEGSLNAALKTIAKTLENIENEIKSVPPRRNVRSTTEGGRQ